jgi:hypothetical protein
MDSSLIFLGNSPAEILSIWLKKLEYIKKVGGLAVVTTHTDTHFSGNANMLGIYRRLLEEIHKDSTAWITTPHVAADWWKQRMGRQAPARDVQR